VRELFDPFYDLDMNAEFLPQLASQALFDCFAGLAFPTGKFPKPSQVRPGRSLGDQQFAIPKNQARGDLNHASNVGCRARRAQSARFGAGGLLRSTIHLRLASHLPMLL
jgi:hypothetical protein